MDKNNTNSTQIPVFFHAISVADFEAIIEQAVEKKLLQHLANMNNTLDPEELLSREEAAKEFKVSIATIDNYRRQGWIEPSRIGGKVQYKRRVLQAAFSGSVLNPYKVTKSGKK